MSDVTQKLERAFAAVPRLRGKENWVEWDMRVKVALRMSGCGEYIDEEELDFTSDRTGAAKRAWDRQDKQIAATLLNATDFPILSAFFHLLDEAPKGVLASATSLRPTLRIYTELRTTYGTQNAQYTFQLGRAFISSSCADGDDVEAWVNRVKAQYRELKALNFDLDALCVDVLLNGLPESFHAFQDSIWTTTTTPSIDYVSDAIVRIQAGHRDLHNLETETHLLPGCASPVLVIGQPLRKVGPSPESPCRVCNSTMHWAYDCPHRRHDDQPASGEAIATVAYMSPDFDNDGYDSAGSAF